MKELDLRLTVAELVKKYPELKEILAELGFEKVLSPVAIKVLGSVMTLPRGAALKGIPMDKIRQRLEAGGFSIKDGAAILRKEKLRHYIERLNAGEPLEFVREEFAKEFQDVAAEDIAAAEQEIIQGGTPVQDVQRLCDVHSALFHGTEESSIHEAIHLQATRMDNLDGQNLPQGHPVQIMKLENQGLLALLDKTEEDIQAGGSQLVNNLSALRAIYGHYAKKESIFMPVLYDHGVTGPSQVMWGVDDEIKKELITLWKGFANGNVTLNIMTRGRLSQLLQRLREMAFKEERILFPLCLRYFSEEEWFLAYHDFTEAGVSFIESAPKWEEGERWFAKEMEHRGLEEAQNGLVRLPTGEISIKELASVFALLPIDITFIDRDDIIRFFINEGRTFARPWSVIGREVYNCHPPEVLPVVRQLLADFRAKKRDRFEVYRQIKGRPVAVIYRAVYDKDKRYLGAVEFVQDCSTIVEKFSKP